MNNTEKPYTSVFEYAKQIDKNAKTLSYEDKVFYLNNLYNITNTHYYKKNKLYSIKIFDENSKNLVGNLYYNDNLELVFTTDECGSEWIDFTSKFKRFYRICDCNRNLCGLYDTKNDKFSGFKFSYANIKNTFSGVPTIVVDNKRVCVQPLKRIGNSIVRGSSYTVIGIIGLPITLPMYLYRR